MRKIFLISAVFIAACHVDSKKEPVSVASHELPSADIRVKMARHSGTSPPTGRLMLKFQAPLPTGV